MESKANPFSGGGNPKGVKSSWKKRAQGAHLLDTAEREHGGEGKRKMYVYD
jgi:hypothetical protein